MTWIETSADAERKGENLFDETSRQLRRARSMATAAVASSAAADSQSRGCSCKCLGCFLSAVRWSLPQIVVLAVGCALMLLLCIRRYLFIVILVVIVIARSRR